MSKFAFTPEAKVKNARITLLVFLILSFVNMFIIATFGRYFLFSAYVPQAFMTIAAIFGNVIILMMMMFLSLICLLPYFLCCVFYNKHIGWEIAALTIFCVDFVIFVIDFIYSLLFRDFSLIVDLIFHIYALIVLIFGIVGKYQLNKKELAEAEKPIDFVESGESRLLTVSRKKVYIASALPILVYINGKEVCRLKYGEKKNIKAPVETYDLDLKFATGEGGTTRSVPAGEEAVQYNASVELKFSKTQIVLESAS